MSLFDTIMNRHNSFLLDTGTLLDQLAAMGLEIIPERIASATRWPHRIDGAFLLRPLKKHTLQPLLDDMFFTGKPVFHTTEISFHKIDTVHLQKTADTVDLLLINPDITRFSAATVARTALTGAGIKDKIKTIHLDKTHIVQPFLLNLPLTATASSA